MKDKTNACWASSWCHFALLIAGAVSCFGAKPSPVLAIAALLSAKYSLPLINLYDGLLLASIRVEYQVLRAAYAIIFYSSALSNSIRALYW